MSDPAAIDTAAPLRFIINAASGNQALAAWSGTCDRAGLSRD